MKNTYLENVAKNMAAYGCDNADPASDPELVRNFFGILKMVFNQGRDQGLDEAAEIARKQMGDNYLDNGSAGAWEHCAEGIRALILSLKTPAGITGDDKDEK